MITAYLLFFAALYTIWWFLKSMLSPFFSSSLQLPSFLPSLPKRGFSERRAFRKCTQSLNRVKNLFDKNNLDKNNFSEIKRNLRSSLFLSKIDTDPALIGESTHHHISLLELLIKIAERQQISLTNLPLLEQLLTKRGELLKSLFETKSTQQRVLQKRNQKGKSTPDWGNQDFKTRISNITEEIQTNKKSILKTLDITLFSLFEAPEKHSENSDLYH